MTDPNLYGMLKVWRVLYIILFLLNIVFIRDVNSPIFTAIASVTIAFLFLGNYKSIKDIEKFNNDLNNLNKTED